ncbi:MAG: CinA family protein [Alphaproteobacteria bacterium]|nr:CinA family protein [Alphaproteobacteria bacterium]
MQELLPRAERIAARLKARGETIAVAESSTGGLISAALLAIGGASAYFMGGAVVYTRTSRAAVLGVSEEELAGIRPSTEAYALLFARKIREKLGTNWALGETGATGPTGNRYGDAAGHSCIAIVGHSEKAITIETGKPDRLDNMRAFSVAALELLEQSLG